VSRDEIRIGSNNDGIVRQNTADKVTVGRSWAGNIRDEILKSVMDRSQSFEKAWTATLHIYPIPKEAPSEGFSEEEAKLHLEHIWNEVRRQLDERGDL
jgi:hypothetical protein